MTLLIYLTFTSKKYPTNADASIANVPQKQMRIIDFPTDEPPAFAATEPENARKIIAQPY